MLHRDRGPGRVIQTLRACLPGHSGEVSTPRLSPAGELEVGCETGLPVQSSPSQGESLTVAVKALLSFYKFKLVLLEKGKPGIPTEKQREV